MARKILFNNIHIDSYSMSETISLIENAIENNNQLHHTVVNAGKIVLMQNDKELEKSVVEADIINADGQAVVWAANLFGHNITERVAGIDLMEKLIEISYLKNYKCFFLGAKEEVVQKLVSIYKKKYSEKIIVSIKTNIQSLLSYFTS